MNRTLSKHENRITVLENEVGFLRKQVNSLIKKIRKFTAAKGSNDTKAR